MKRGPINDMPEAITLVAETGSVLGLIEFVSTHAWEYGFNDETIAKLVIAVEEALNNIIQFAGTTGRNEQGEITISCSIHNSGALSITIADTGIPFNMLLASTFPEAYDITEADWKPSTGMMKRIVKNVEYRRVSDRNILIFLVSKDLL